AFVVLSGQHTKNGKEAKQPLPPFLRKALAPYVATLADEDFLWPGRWVDRPIAMLELDATKVGVLVGRKHADANGGVVYDVHAFGHFFATMIDRVGVSERLARKLARTSSSALLDRYTTREFAELTAAVEGFPSIRVGGG